MKRVVLLMLIAMAAFSLDAQALFAGQRTGVYAIYGDTRFEEPTIIGLCVVDENTLMLRSFTPGSKTELLLQASFSIDTSDHSIQPKSLKIIAGDLKKSGSSIRLLPMVMNWIQAWLASKEKISSALSYKVSMDEDYNFEYWIPCLQLRGIDLGQKKNLRLITAGLFRSNSDRQFFDFKTLPNIHEFPSYKIQTQEKKDVTLGGVHLVLDLNWKTEDGNIYRLQQTTKQDAILMVETIDLHQYNIHDPKELLPFFLLGGQGIFLADGSTVTQTKERYNIVFRKCDPASGRVTIQKTTLIPGQEGALKAITLAAFETLYRTNQDYFDRIVTGQ